MKNAIYGFIVVTCLGGFLSANGESLLKAASFPKTFEDLPFIARMEVLTEGYADVESIYDKDGRCISGCPYAGITIEEETEAIRRNTQLANNAISAYINEPTNTTPSEIPTTNVPSERLPINTQPINTPSTNILPVTTPAPNPPATVTPHPTSVPVQSGPYTCAKYRATKRTVLPLNSPIDTGIIVSSDFGPRKAPMAGTTSWHKGIDISVPTGTNIYATGDGTIEYIRDQGNQGGGKYVIVKHGNSNFRTAYMHLSNNQVLKVGDTIQAGCLIGISGNTGASTGPHLHYTIYYTAPGKKFGWAGDAIDSVWPQNYFDTGYRFRSQSVKSCLHNPRNFCAGETANKQVPTDPLPGEIK